ncbi:MAG: hypothetical protein AYK18_07995 [Theionarchaea archaeon DG-70]|nr:MAG: hypothetical protein AYK18_07995 [Theionarchaea archaeon DG-70]
MKESCIIKNPEQVKVMAHPLRMSLIEVFSHKPMTAKQAAQLLGQKPTRLYHHVDALERVGLIRLVKTQKKRGTLEKYYRTVAHHFIVDRMIFQSKAEEKETLGKLQATVGAMFDETLSEINRSMTQRLIEPDRKSKSRQAIFARTRIKATHEQVEKIKKKIDNLLKQCNVGKRKQGEVEYGLTLAFYPIKKK